MPPTWLLVPRRLLAACDYNSQSPSMYTGAEMTNYFYASTRHKSLKTDLYGFFRAI